MFKNISHQTRILLLTIINFKNFSIFLVKLNYFFSLIYGSNKTFYRTNYRQLKCFSKLFLMKIDLLSPLIAGTENNIQDLGYHAESQINCRGK